MSDVETDYAHDLEIWKYYGAIGGADKDRMIQIVSWLLAFSSAILGAYASGKLVVFRATIMLLILGMLLSLLAAFTALLYGGYATWNWSIADRIAEQQYWEKQKPKYDPFDGLHVPSFSRFPLWLAKPCERRIACVFKLFFLVSLFSLSAHALVLYWVGRSRFPCP
jgi:hypothetical protein